MDFQEKKPHDFDFSELLLYENMILREWGRPDKALEHLEENCAHILDKLQYFTIRGKRIGKKTNPPEKIAHQFHTIA